MLKIAKGKDLVLEVMVKPGDHVVYGDVVARAWGTGLLSESEVRDILDALLLGGERTPAQDIRYHFQQLTDVIVRALSPGINDPFTALNGIDELGSGLAHLARQPRAVERRSDDQGRLRLVMSTAKVDEILDSTVGHVAIYAAADRFVMAGLLRVLDTVEPHLRGDAEHNQLKALRAAIAHLIRAKAPADGPHGNRESATRSLERQSFTQ